MFRKNGICKLPQRGLRRSPSRHYNFAAFWTEMEASGAMIPSNVCSFMDDAFTRLDFQPVVMDFIIGM